MDKRVIKEFSIMARNELRSQVKRMANSFGVYEDKNGRIEYGNDYVIINDKTYPKAYATAYNKIIEVKKEKGFEELIEEVAYTWFNRFIALRFMEINDYLPSHIRVLSSETKGKVDPDILEHYEESDLDVKFDEIYKIINVDKNVELAYRKLLIAQCNKLSTLMPFLFEKINDYTEMLLPDNLLIPESIISKLVATISEDDFKEEVEIIGWIYQYYISEKKDKVFADLKKNIKISKENIPAATQLFTPKWIVKYMVENSLGRLWLEGHPNEELQKEWKYYLEEAEQEAEVQVELKKIKDEHAKLTPEDIKILDPCMGSGHILVYAFDVLYEIYKTAGYSSRDIPKLILKNNLYGLDIDDRAAQLASFALVMKARQYNKRIFKEIEKENIELNLCSIQESNIIEEETIDYFCSLNTGLDNDELRKKLQYLCTTFKDAKEYGSILEVEEVDFEALKQRLGEIKNDDSLIFEDYRTILLDKLYKLIKQSEIMSKQYESCITNPPYMGSKGMSSKLKKYVDENYVNSKSDLFAIFMEKSINLIKLSGIYSMINQHSWMFLSSYNQLRKDIIENQDMINMIHLGSRTFEEISGEVVQSTSFCIRKFKVLQYITKFVNLTEYSTSEKESELKNNINEVNTKVNKFIMLDGFSMGYWISDKVMKLFKEEVPLGQIAKPRKGNSTSDNKRFLRIWYEVENELINFNCQEIIKERTLNKRWFPYNKGGGYRKWYGNNIYLIDWKNDGEEIRKIPTSVIANYEFFMEPGLTWSTVSTAKFSLRKFGHGFIFDNGGCCIFSDEENRNYYLGLLNSNIFDYILGQMNSTVNYQSGEIAKFPVRIPKNNVVKSNIDAICDRLVSKSKDDWDSFETSWHFRIHPLLKLIDKCEQHKLESIFLIWKTECEIAFEQLKDNEQELNKIFIDIYQLQDELTPEVDDKDITIRKADRERDIKSLLSYAVGCMFGRYSLDAEGLIYAGGDFTDKWNIEEKKVRKIEKDEDGNILSDNWVDTTFMPDIDNTIPVTENEYFDDDIVDRLVEFIKTVYGEDTLEENLDFIADTLVKRNSESSVERIRRYFVDEFYKDHCRIYQKRPIYWMIDSGKNKGFKALIYLHRYNKETLSNVRLNYLLELQGKYLNEQKQIERYLDSSSISTVEKKKRTKELQILSQKQAEVLAFDKVLDEFANKQIELDLDDGVVVNYGKLQQVLAKIK